MSSPSNSNSDHFEFLHDPESPGTNGSVLELKRCEARYNSKGDRILLRVGRKNEIPRIEADKASAMTLTRYYKQSEHLDYTELEIRSPHMRKALREVIQDYPDVTLDTTVIRLRNEPRCIFHYRKELETYSQSQDTEARKHVVFMLRYMCEALKSEMIIFYHHIETSVLPESLDFQNLWMAFRPGDLVYHRIGEIENLYEFRSMSRCPCRDHNCWNADWKLSCLYINYDGEDYGYCSVTIKITSFSNYRRLDALDCFPLKYYSDQALVKERLVSRGRAFLELHGIHHRMYDGKAEQFSPLWSAKIEDDEDEYPLQSIQLKGRVIVDTATMYNEKPWHRIGFSSTRRYFKPNSSDYAKLTQDNIAVCSSTIQGFALASKKWCYFRVDKLMPVGFNKDAFEQLLLPYGQKQMILSLVESQAQSSNRFDDIIAGKGRGMVFLLHGSPGTGKTLTAESVADYTEKALYVVSSGDLGTKPQVTESNLSTIMHRASAWNAIVLIDEADVFLEQRRATDIVRNSLVSVFLRLIEYNESLIFITTNQVESFDTAFKSRIHLSIHFPDLSADKRSELWRLFLTRASQDSDVSWLGAKDLQKLAVIDLNGRQIKNIARIAQALAIRLEATFGIEHVKTVLEAQKVSTETEDQPPVVEDGDSAIQLRARKRARHH